MLTTVARRNWFWFGPLAALALVIVEVHTVPYGFSVAKIAVKRWDWGGFISPSAYFCWTVVLSSVLMPINGLFLATTVLFDSYFRISDRGCRWRSLLFLVTV